MVDLADLYAALRTTGYPVANIKFSVAVAPPFIILASPGTENIIADNTVYQKIETLDIELYTDKRDLIAEEKVEEVLKNLELPWDRNAFYIGEEKLLNTIYEVTLL